MGPFFQNQVARMLVVLVLWMVSMRVRREGGLPFKIELHVPAAGRNMLTHGARGGEYVRFPAMFMWHASSLLSWEGEERSTGILLYGFCFSIMCRLHI